MAFKLTDLPKTQFSGLDYDNILEDITNLVIENPEYNENWDDFLSSNAGRMLSELYAYITDQLATRIDWIVNENYIGTATQKRSVQRMLKLIGYKFTLPISAYVDVTTVFDRTIGDFTLTEAFNPNSDSAIFSPFSLTANDKNGVARNFETINFNSETDRYDYLSNVIVETGTITSPNLSSIETFYEGTTYVETFISTTDNGPVFELSKKSVVEGSVAVYVVQESESSPIYEALEVSSFLDPNAQKIQDDFGNDLNIPYITNVLDEDGVSVEFGSTSLLPSIDRRLEEGSKVRVIYRVGSGINGNITKQAINKTIKLSVVVGIETVITNVSFINTQEGSGGEDSETLEHAATFAPLSIRTANKAVTENDYDILLNGEATILKSKTYGNNNMPSNVYEQYGLYIKPLEVWNFILKLKTGWEDINPSEYNDFQWITLRMENWFNEMWHLTDGDLGTEVSYNFEDL